MKNKIPKCNFKTKLHKYAYVAVSAAKQSIHQWKMSMLVLMAFFFGLLLVAAALSMLEYSKGFAEPPFVIDAQKVYCLDFKAHVLPMQTVNQLTKELSGEKACIRVSFARAEIPEWEQEVYLAGVAGAPDDIYSVPIYAGRFFTQEELADDNCTSCVVSPAVQLMYGAQLGDVITVQNIPYTIIGFGGLTSGEAGILLPLKSHYTNAQTHNMYQQTLTISSDEQLLQKQAQIYFKKAKIEATVYSVRTGQQIINLLKSETFVRTTIGISVFSLCFMLFNVILILMGRMRIKTYFYTIERAIGAPCAMVALQFFFENLFIVLFAELGVLFALPPLLQAMQFPQVNPYNPIVYILITVVSVIYCALGALALGIYHARSSITQLMKQEGAHI
ncbi:MAG: ABC transporter permease [Oscillospiraceae bacterium]